ncbi:MAG: CaiB/BaiF CoA-transferase family protein [Rhodospirillales bacterium]
MPSGPLNGLKVVEMAGIGPAPMCAMLLADLGAEIIRIDRLEPSGLGAPQERKYDLLLRSRPAIAIDLKQKNAVDLALRLIDTADAVIEGFRPGVMERLGLGPEVCLARNPRLVFGRMTGWGQEGPIAHAAGHDLNYIALAGVLHAIGRKGGPPTPPLNLVGDFGGGTMYLAFGVMCALFEAGKTGKGQVVDAAMVDGAASLMTSYFGHFASGFMTDQRGENMNDSGAYFYDVYECSDGKWVSLAPIEAKFHAELLERLGINPTSLPEQWDRSSWDEVKARLGVIFKTKTRAQWQEELEGTDVCFAPVLGPDEAPDHPHLASRKTFVEVDGIVQPAPAPRFSNHSSPMPTAAKAPSPENSVEALKHWLPEGEPEALRKSGLFG